MSTIDILAATASFESFSTAYLADPESAKQDWPAFVSTVAWNSVAYPESGSIFDQVLSGPIAIPKDGSEYLVLGSSTAAPPVEPR